MRRIARSHRRCFRRTPPARPGRAPALTLILIFTVLLPATLPHPATATPAVETTSVYVPMRDGTRIAVDVHLPADRGDDARFPALLELTRYWRASEDPATGERRPLTGELDLNFLEHGYALVKVDVRGSGASFGHRPLEYGPEEVRDGRDVVDWVVRQSWSNGRVGAYGTSYTGTTAELLAASGHPAVKAVIPGWSDFDVFRSPARPYGLMATGFIARWSEFVGLLDRNDPAAGGSVARVDADVDGRLLAAAVREHAANPDVFEAVSKADFRDRAVAGGLSLADASVMAWKKQIEASGVPMLVLVSWLDAGTADGALLRLEHFTNPQKLVILASMHGGGAHASPYTVSTEPRSPQPSFEEQMALRLRFFDHHLKGAKNGVPDWPRVRYFNLGEEAFRDAETWPPPGTRRQRWYLAAGRSLATAAPAGSGHDRYAVDFSVSTGTTNRWTTQMGEPVLRLDDRGAMDARMLAYTSPPLAEDLQITGTPVVTLWLRSSRDDGAILVYLEDVDPEGRSRYLTEGGLRALHRRLSANPYFAQAPPYHSFAAADAEPLMPGEPAELAFQLWPTSARIRAGHRLRLAIAGADADTFDRVPADGEVEIKVGWGGAEASLIELPVVTMSAR